jgi:uncharacterized protein (DUF2062 family)
MNFTYTLGRKLMSRRVKKSREFDVHMAFFFMNTYTLGRKLMSRPMTIS